MKYFRLAMENYLKNILNNISYLYIFLLHIDQKVFEYTFKYISDLWFKIFQICDLKYFRFATWNARMTQNPIWSILRSAPKMVWLFSLIFAQNFNQIRIAITNIWFPNFDELSNFFFFWKDSLRSESHSKIFFSHPSQDGNNTMSTSPNIS